MRKSQCGKVPRHCRRGVYSQGSLRDQISERRHFGERCGFSSG
jgi:hypothetical protein